MLFENKPLSWILYFSIALLLPSVLKLLKEIFGNTSQFFFHLLNVGFEFEELFHLLFDLESAIIDILFENVGLGLRVFDFPRLQDFVDYENCSDFY